MFYEYKSLLTNTGDNRKNDIFYVKLNDDYGIIKIELILLTNAINCKLYNHFTSNFLC